MNLQNPFRSELGGVSNWINEALDNIMAKINAMWNVQHKGDGSHGAVTADSLTLAAATTYPTTGNVTGSLVPTTITQDLGATILKNGSISADHPFRNLRLSGSINFGPFSETGIVDSPILSRSGGNMTFNVPNGSLTFTLTNGVNTHTVTFGAGILGLTSSNSITAGAFVVATSGFLERSRSTAVGEWITYTYNGGNFSASAGSWTVDVGDYSVFRYMLVGKTLWVNFALITTSVSNAGVSLRFALPGGFTCATATQQFVRVSDAGGALTTGLLVAAAASALVDIYATVAAGGFGIAVNNTTVVGMVAIEVS